MNIWPEVTWQVSRRARIASGSGPGRPSLPELCLPDTALPHLPPQTKGGYPLGTPWQLPPSHRCQCSPHPTPVHTAAWGRPQFGAGAGWSPIKGDN